MMLHPRIGESLSEVMEPTHADQPPTKLFISPFSDMAATARRSNVSGTSGAWEVANCPFAVPFFVFVPTVVYQLGWYNGTAAGDHIDVGVYDSSWNRKISAGSTVGSGNTSLQFVDVTDTTLAPGKYYLVMAIDTTTANRIMAIAETVAHVSLLGCQDSATTAFPLPDPLTNMAAVATFTKIPVMYAATRALV